MSEISLEQPTKPPQISKKLEEISKTLGELQSGLDKRLCQLHNLRESKEPLTREEVAIVEIAILRKTQEGIGKLQQISITLQDLGKTHLSAAEADQHRQLINQQVNLNKSYLLEKNRQQLLDTQTAAREVFENGKFFGGQYLILIDAQQNTMRTQEDCSHTLEELTRLKSFVKTMPRHGFTDLNGLFKETISLINSYSINLDKYFLSIRDHEKQQALRPEKIMEQANKIVKEIADLHQKYYNNLVNKNSKESSLFSLAKKINEQEKLYSATLQPLRQQGEEDLGVLTVVQEVDKRVNPVLQAFKKEEKNFLDRRTKFIEKAKKTMLTAQQFFLSATKELKPNNLRYLTSEKVSELTGKMLQAAANFQHEKQLLQTRHYTNNVYFVRNKSAIQQAEKHIFDNCLKLSQSLEAMFTAVDQTFKTGDLDNILSLISQTKKALHIIATLEALPTYKASFPADWRMIMQGRKQNGQMLLSKLSSLPPQPSIASTLPFFSANILSPKTTPSEGFSLIRT